MKKISPYYSNYFKGRILANGKSIAQLRMAVDFFKNAINIRETEEAYIELLKAYTLLNNVKNYVDTSELCLQKGYSMSYVSYGLLLAGTIKACKEYADKDKALAVFGKAMELKQPDAFAELAKIYRIGTCVIDADSEKSFELLNQGLALNDNKWNGYFMCEIGRHLASKEEFTKALDMFNKAVENGYINANYDIAMMYKEGLGVEADPELYVEHLGKYLCAESALELGEVFLTNKYAQLDMHLSEVYFNYAANQGNSIGAIMSAAFLLNKNRCDENLLNRYLEIGFKNSSDDDVLKSKYDYIDDTFGPKLRRKLQDLAEKYWNRRSNEA